jgi:hypothetical protein
MSNFSKTCFHCGKEIDFTLLYPGFSLDGKRADIAFHSACRGEFAKILIDSMINDLKYWKKREEKIEKGEWER